MQIILDFSVRQPYPIPKISTTLQELDGFTYAMAHGLLHHQVGPNGGQDVHHHIPIGQILILEITNGNEGLGRHLPGRKDGPDGNLRVCMSIY